MSYHANQETKQPLWFVKPSSDYRLFDISITMNFRSNTSALNEDIIVYQLLHTHDPDGRWLDSEMLLQEVETILSFVRQNDVRSIITMPLNFQVSTPLLTEDCITNIEVSESKETLPYAISRISVQVTDISSSQFNYSCKNSWVRKS